MSFPRTNQKNGGPYYPIMIADLGDGFEANLLFNFDIAANFSVGLPEKNR